MDENKDKTLSGGNDESYGSTFDRNTEDVKKEMEKYMPESYLPDLIKIESLKEYMLIGCILLGLKEM